MKSEKRTRHFEWPYLQTLGLCPGIDSFETYVRRVTEGEGQAAIKTLTEPTRIPTPPEISEMHRILFGVIHPWAGQFNRDGDDVWFGGMLSCDPLFIQEELDQLVSDTASLLKDSSPEGCARAVAFYHAKFERIHPFRDGNGRVGRALMESQMTALFGLTDRGAITSREYHTSLVKAQRRSNLRPLLNYVLRLEGRQQLPNEHEPLPFRMKPRYGTIERKMARRRKARNR